MVLCLNWSNDTQYLASGGEDCRYKVWDKQGANIYSSIVDDFSITSIEFSPNGQLLAVGGFNMLKLCNFSGVINVYFFIYNYIVAIYIYVHIL